MNEVAMEIYHGELFTLMCVHVASFITIYLYGVAIPWNSSCVQLYVAFILITAQRFLHWQTSYLSTNARMFVNE